GAAGAMAARNAPATAASMACPADVHVPGAAAAGQLGGALTVVVRDRLGGAAVEDGELAAAGAAGGQAPQQRAALPHRPGARLAGLRPDIGPDALLVSQAGIPAREPAPCRQNIKCAVST